MRRFLVMAAAVVTAAAAFVVAGAGLATRVDHDAGPGSHRAAFGVVVTEVGDPLPSVEFIHDGLVLGESNALGEFCWFVPGGDAWRVVAHRDRFADEALSVPAGEGDIEMLVRMLPADDVRRGARRRFFIVDTLSRGVPDSLVTVIERSSGASLFNGRSAPDGAIYWDGPRARGPEFDLRATTRGVTTARESVRLIDGDALPIDDAGRPGQELGIQLQAQPGLRDGTDVCVLDETQRTLWCRTIEHGTICGTAPYGADLWVCSDDGVASILRHFVPRAGAATVVSARGDSQALSLPADAELVAAAPVVLPIFGRPRVVYGEMMTDVAGGCACERPQITLRLAAGRLCSPLLDLDVRGLSLRAACKERDLRVIADLSSAACARPPGGRIESARVVRGDASVTVRLTADAAIAESWFVTLARRGGSYAQTKRLRPDGAATWTALCAGAFLLTAERGAPNEPLREIARNRIQVFDDVRRVLVGPAERLTVDVRISRDDDAPAVLRATRR